MRLRALLPLIPLCLFLGLLSGPALRAQDPALKDTFLQAKALWATQGDREAATAKFEAVVAALAPKAPALDPAWTQTLCETYNWLAVLDDRSPATKARALVRLQSLIDLNPDFDVDRTLTSQRLVGIFDRLRSEKLAQVKLSYTPEGGTLTVDGKPTPALPRKFLAFGSHKLVYARPGHAPAEATVDLAPRDVKTVDFKLTRTSSTVTLYVQPSGAEVFLDGRSLGHTQGAAGAEAIDVAVPAGLRPEDLSAGFVMGELKPGKHELELRAPCFRTKQLELAESFATPADHVLAAIRMEPSRGTLSVASAWPGGELVLSGQDRGPLPIQKLPVCSGTYDLLVRFPSGGFSHHLTVAEGDSVVIEARPKPRLALVGLEGTEAFTGRDRFLGLLNQLGERLQQVAFIPPRPGESPADAETRLRTSHEAELILLAVPMPDKVIHRVELRLSTLEGETDHSVVQPLEEDPLGPLVTRLNTLPPQQEPGLDATLLDLPGEPGPWVLAASDAALKAGLQVHRPITHVDGKAVANLQAFRQVLAGAKDKVVVTQGGAPMTLPILRAPLELPLSSHRLVYPAVLAHLRLQYLGAKGDEANLLKLDMGLALMHFHKYDKAIEVLRDAHLSTIAGVSQGTLDYETGLCFMRLGNAYYSEATQAFRQALKYPQATLFGPDGPLVAPLARQALEDLK